MNLKNALSDAPFQYIQQGIEAMGHTPIYKMHKYFARRPHNVFRYLLEAYTKAGDIILDPFCGGGVTLVEGLSIGRSTVVVDVNPLATFISECQTTQVSLDEYRQIMSEVLKEIKSWTERYYTTQCRKCGEKSDVRWFELAYRVICNSCGKQTLLSNENKVSVGGKLVNGQYQCQHCSSCIIAVNSTRVGYDLQSVTYRCKHETRRQTVAPNEQDIKLMQEFEEHFDELIETYNLWYPQDEIPAHWDRQQEDCLHRKSIHKFADLFTRRSLFFNAYLLKSFRHYRDTVSPEMYKMLIFTFSAIIRYTNNMTFSTGSWMDGRPVSWAKHAYWIPNQFVEVNPIEYVQKRSQAIIAGLKFQQQNLIRTKLVKNFSELKDKEGTHIIWTGSANKLSIPDNSIDAIVTDPPYGSNVQYGELSHFWLVWLRDELGLRADELFELDEEILVNRRTHALRHKDYDDYFRGLKGIFIEGFRVLKPGGTLVFTFNNKDIKAWYSVMRAAIEAGFYLDHRGVIYQEPIEDYKNTAHTRYAGSLHGDFIYTFRKLDTYIREGIPSSSINDLGETVQLDINGAMYKAAEQYLLKNGSATTSELYITMIPTLIPIIVKIIQTDEELDQLNRLLDFNNLDRFLGHHFVLRNDTKTWQLKEEF